jgi:hypothetical protein
MIFSEGDVILEKKLGKIARAKPEPKGAKGLTTIAPISLMASAAEGQRN